MIIKRINGIDVLIVVICSVFVAWIYMQRNKYMVIKESKSFHHPSMMEISGIEQDHLFKNYIWSHNDSGDSARIFVTRIPDLTKKDQLLKDYYELKIEHHQFPIQNIDWEDLALSDQRFLYIGDIGNNFQWRRDLMIYRVDLNAQIKTIEDLKTLKSLKADGIAFEYPNQSEFPPINWDQRKFDAEAMMIKDERLYLINKAFMGGDRNEILIYRFPMKEELDLYIHEKNQNKIKIELFQKLILKPIKDQNTNTSYSPLSLRVTASDYLAPYLAILCYEHIFLFKWESDQISQTPSYYLKLSPKIYKQVEALTWLEQENQEPILMIANEQRRIFYLQLSAFQKYEESKDLGLNPSAIIPPNLNQIHSSD
jgi:hypothetical protein